ncbi:MAG: hypothetical protein LBT89_10660 [Planctomycetaceae bacterium]|jgi:hypothetical protein|nr:hypothetical protein [Planctomycetaceae bacterium]
MIGGKKKQSGISPCVQGGEALHCAMNKTVSVLLAVLIIVSLAGCESLKNAFKRKDNAPPMITADNPSLEHITSAINRNSQMIHTLTAENASVYVPGVLLPLQSKIVFERPKKLRIQGAASSLSSKEFDFGSNDTLFWFWMRLLKGEMYYCRHDQFAVCPVRSNIPIEPEWLIDAMGLAEFKPNDRHSGPTKTADGNWEIVSLCQTPSGQFTKRTVVDAKVGWIIRQEMYSPQNELIASSAATDLRYDRSAGIYYPKRVSVQCRGAEGTITIDLGVPVFNTQQAPPSMFEMPPFDGYRAIDLCSPEFLRSRGSVMPGNPDGAAAVPAVYNPTALIAAPMTSEPMTSEPARQPQTSQAAIETVVR